MVVGNAVGMMIEMFASMQRKGERSKGGLGEQMVAMGVGQFVAGCCAGERGCDGC